MFNCEPHAMICDRVREIDNTFYLFLAVKLRQKKCAESIKANYSTIIRLSPGTVGDMANAWLLSKFCGWYVLIYNI